MTEWSKAGRLAVAGAVAPSLRRRRGASRRVARLNATGEVVGYTTLEKVQEGLLLDRKIAIQLADPVRPREVVCERCGALVPVKRRGPLPTYCARCLAICAPLPICPCGAEIPADSLMPAAHNGHARRCDACVVQAIGDAVSARGGGAT